MLSHFKVVLVETSHPGNIGGVARAMKNMGMSNLCLVNPKIFPSADATSRASGASDLLSAVEICHSLQDAIVDCQIVLGASTRDRTISWPELTARECAEKFVTAEQSKNKIALVFGRENSGLKNHELDLCHYLLHIPCNPKFSSLNLAAAVQVVCYELFVASGQKAESTIGDKNEIVLASTQQMELFYEHMQQTLLDIDFLHPEKSVSIMRRLRRIYNRISLDTKELDILRGILRFSQNHNNK
ncbi:MAG: RNA methyltransferase [Methylococcales symbiont of Iophon sp. n. MRB-2018]|nr:MAG: RNA methyltransferase [Methylococcales symbiont of Iophon sp. n. MRB-2018]KAF3979570.1 MAG: RNA methyltransferase [Methylococcales symbiont of Iophon sp. n. MRB-2018]